MHKISKIISFMVMGLTLSSTLAFADKVLKLNTPTPFGTVTAGSTATQNLIIKNMGTEPLVVTEIRFHENLDGVYTGGWIGTIPAGGQQSVPITFTPTENRDYIGSIYVESDRTNTTEDRDTLLVGTGITHIVPCTGILKMGKHLNFDENWADSNPGTSKTIALTLKNEGWCDLTITGLRYHECIASEYSGNWSGIIPAGGSHDVDITFTPIGGGIHCSAGEYNGLVYVESDKTNVNNSSDDNRVLIGKGSSILGLNPNELKSN